MITTYATIEEWQGYRVPFVLWEITKKDEKQLDRYEGYPKHYQKKYIDAEVNGEVYKALVYVKDDSLPVNIASDHYVAVLWEAYEEFGFDIKILEEARAFSNDRYQRLMY